MNFDYLPLAMFGGSMLSQAGPHPQGQGGFGPAFGNALNAGVQGLAATQQMDEGQQASQLRRIQLLQQMAEMQRAAAMQMKQQQALETATKGLPEDQAAFAQAFPAQFGQARAASMFPEPATPHSALAQMAADVKSGFMTPEQFNDAYRKATYIAPQQQREAPAPLFQDRRNPDGTVTKVVSYDRGGNWQEFGAPAPADIGPLEEVYDPNSPTGSRMKQRAGAVDQPGKPPSGGLAITGYDAQGRPLIQMGGIAKEKPLPADTVGRASAVKGAVEDIKAVTDYVMPGGKLDRMNIAKLNPPIPFMSGSVPGTDAGGPNAQLGNSVDTMMRLRTGAGMPVAEKQDYLNRYTPSVTDTEDTVKTKLGLLRRDLEEAQRGFDAAQNKPQQTDQPSTPAVPDKPPVRLSGTTPEELDAEYDKLPSGTPFIGPDGKPRVKP